MINCSSCDGQVLSGAGTNYKRRTDEDYYTTSMASHRISLLMSVRNGSEFHCIIDSNGPMSSLAFCNRAIPKPLVEAMVRTVKVNSADNIYPYMKHQFIWNI